MAAGGQGTKYNRINKYPILTTLEEFCTTYCGLKLGQRWSLLTWRDQWSDKVVQGSFRCSLCLAHRHFVPWHEKQTLKVDRYILVIPSVLGSHLALSNYTIWPTEAFHSVPLGWKFHPARYHGDESATSRVQRKKAAVLRCKEEIHRRQRMLFTYVPMNIFSSQIWNIFLEELAFFKINGRHKSESLHKLVPMMIWVEKI